jgi:hypothetical protein
MTSIKKRRITSRLLTNVCTLALSCSFFCFFCLRRYHGVVLRSSVFSSSIFPHAFSFVAPNSFLLVDRRSTYSCHIVLLMDPWLDLYVSTWQSSHKVSTLGISRSYRMLVSSLVTDWWCRRKRYMHNSGFHSGSLCCCIIPLYRSTVVTCNFSIFIFPSFHCCAKFWAHYYYSALTECSTLWIWFICAEFVQHQGLVRGKSWKDMWSSGEGCGKYLGQISNPRFILEYMMFFRIVAQSCPMSDSVPTTDNLSIGIPALTDLFCWQNLGYVTGNEYLHKVRL